tara:strand:- start:1675 stop:1920 length:246 start_codon:yes stop_codon:yes gene_type:complete
MIIPIRCYTCGKKLADKKQYYDSELLKRKISTKKDEEELMIDINAEEVKKTIAGHILDDLGLTRMCCRKIMLTNIDLIYDI